MQRTVRDISIKKRKKIRSQKAGKTFTRVWGPIRGIGIESGICNSVKLFATGHFIHRYLLHNNRRSLQKHGNSIRKQTPDHSIAPTFIFSSRSNWLYGHDKSPRTWFHVKTNGKRFWFWSSFKWSLIEILYYDVSARVLHVE